MKAYFKKGFNTIVSTIWANLVVSYRDLDWDGQHGNYKLIFGSFLGRKPILEALWKSLVNHMGYISLTKGDDDDEATDDVYALTGDMVRLLGLRSVSGHIWELALYSKSILTPWAVMAEQDDGVSSSVRRLFAWGRTVDELKARFFAVLDRITTVPLLKEWADELCDYALASENAAISDKEGVRELAYRLPVTVHGDEEHFEPFRHTLLLNLACEPDELVLGWLDRRYHRIEDAADEAA